MTLYTKEGKKLPFTDFLVYSEEHVVPSEVAIYNGAFLLKFAKKIDGDWVLLNVLSYMVCCNYFALLHGPKIVSFLSNVLVLCYYLHFLFFSGYNVLKL